MNTFGINLKAARKNKRLSQSELGKAVGVGNTTICGYESGANTPAIEIMLKLSEALGLTIDELCGSTFVANLNRNSHFEELYRKDLENQLVELDYFYNRKKQEIQFKLSSLHSMQ